jgi:tryptophan-rich sensory protein
MIIDNYTYIIIILPVIIGFFIGSFTKPDKWYEKLNKSPLTPPGYVFGIVWFFLYIIIGISYFIALKDRPLNDWIIPFSHLIINFSYSIIIFRLHLLFLSYLIVLLTLLSAIYITYKFYYYDKSKIAFGLMIPYIIWLLFANFLGFYIYYYNNE